jgi:hypothetical protein
MVRHSIFLSAYVEEGGPDTQSTFRFFVQNLEDVGFQSDVTVTIRAQDSEHPIRQEDVRIYAGPNRVIWRQKSKRQVEITLHSLPAFDTWRIDIATRADVIRLTIEPASVSTVFNRPVFRALEPSEIIVCAKDHSRRRFCGSTQMPDLPVTGLFAIAGLSAYLGYALMRHTLTSAEWFIDALFLLGIAGFTLIGYWLVRTPVYPVTLGYRNRSDIVPQD